jgi:hypothetical protein
MQPWQNSKMNFLAQGVPLLLKHTDTTHQLEVVDLPINSKLDDKKIYLNAIS